MPIELVHLGEDEPTGYCAEGHHDGDEFLGAVRADLAEGFGDMPEDDRPEIELPVVHVRARWVQREGLLSLDGALFEIGESEEHEPFTYVSVRC